MVLLTVDTLRPDHLGLYGYGRPTSPNLDRWFADAALFERAYATEANTSPSVISLLSGQLPQDHGVRLFFQLLPESTPVLPELLPAAYQSAAFVSNFVLTDEAIGLAERLDHYDDFVNQAIAIPGLPPIVERNAADTTDAALRWLRTARDPERPLFLWVHYMDPHGPYRPPASWKRSFGHEGRVPVQDDKLHPYHRDPSIDDALDYVDLYDEEIAYLDREIGRLLEGYAAAADVDDALLVLTADHGETLMSRDRWFTHGYQVYEEILRVPLLIRGPGFRPGRRRVAVSGIDVAPTILAFAGSPRAAKLPGRDLARDPIPPRPVFGEATNADVQWRSVLSGDTKVVARLAPGERGPRFVATFDLAADPEERRPRPVRRGSPGLQELLRLCQADPDPGGLPREAREGMRLSAPKVSPRATPEQLEALRALGYAE